MKIKYSLECCLSLKKVKDCEQRGVVLEVLVGFEVKRITLRVYGTVNRRWREREIHRISIPLASFRHYELSEDTLAQICEADNSARHQPMRKVGEEGRSDEGGGAERREGRVERAAGSVAGASNYSAINNPRVTRVIGPLSLRPPRRSPVRLPSFLATNPRRYQCSWYVNAIVPVCRRHLSLRGTRIDRLHDRIL